MSKIKAIANTALKTVSDNSPTILTTLAVTGTATTAYLAAKAGYRAAIIIRDEEEQTGVQIEDKWERLREHARLTWTLYIPPVATGAATIVCALGANSISNKRTAALAGAYNLTQAAFQEYKEHVTKQLGANKEQKVRDGIAQDRMHQNPVTESNVFVTYNGEVLCYDTYTDRYFRSNMETIRRVENDINRQINNSVYASLNDFYRGLGLPSIPAGEDLGWDADTHLELAFSSVLADENSAYSNQPCLAFSFVKDPKRDYYKIW